MKKKCTIIKIYENNEMILKIPNPESPGDDVPEHALYAAAIMSLFSEKDKKFMKLLNNRINDFYK